MINEGSNCNLVLLELIENSWMDNFGENKFTNQAEKNSYFPISST